jgi:transmembrane sensor
MEQERIWTLLSRKLANEVRNAEIAELEMLLKQHSELNDIVQQITDIWEHPVTNETEFIEATYILHLQRMKEKEISFSSSEPEHITELQMPAIIRKKNDISKYLVLGSCLSLILLFVYYLYATKLSTSSSKENIATTKEIVTKNGTRTKTQLPDGTVVWLNAGSKVTYDGDFSGPIRNVYLIGEAYFDVAHNPNRPFIVHTGDINVRALGTAFNIKSYPSDKVVEATLLRGLVEITRQDDLKAKAIFLRPNQKLTLIKSSRSKINLLGKVLPINSYSVSKVEMQSENELPETAWMFNRLSFKNDDFEMLATKLERWYDVNIVFEDEAVKKIHFNGSFENETVGQAFEALQMAVPFIYKIKDHEIYVSSVSQ